MTGTMSCAARGFARRCKRKRGARLKGSPRKREAGYAVHDPGSPLALGPARGPLAMSCIMARWSFGKVSTGKKGLMADGPPFQPGTVPADQPAGRASGRGIATASRFTGAVMQQVAVEMGARILRVGQHEAVRADHAPAVHGEPRHLRVELDAEGMAAEAEGLVLEGVAGGEAHRARAAGSAPRGASDRPARARGRGRGPARSGAADNSRSRPARRHGGRPCRPDASTASARRGRRRGRASPPSAARRSSRSRGRSSHRGHWRSSGRRRSRRRHGAPASRAARRRGRGGGCRARSPSPPACGRCGPASRSRNEGR